MTPERAKWWDSLPEEEMLIRFIIKHFEEDVKLAKAVLKRHHEAYAAKVCMQTRKRAIKALRKQIAMRPITKHSLYVFYTCPLCEENLYEGFLGIRLPDKYCRHCGQKLRW